MDLWKEIDLTRHGVIEAHAGTGKTYTIVNLVLRLLETTVSDQHHGIRRMHLRELLLVTFTEKAAGELRVRIREELESRISALGCGTGKEKNPLIEHLENNLNNLHEAFIGTIHAVCLRLLQSRPFESGVHFDMETADDTEGLETCLREMMRGDWQKGDNRISPMLMLLARYGKRVGKEHFSLIVKTARELLDTDHTELVRCEPPPEDLAPLQSELERLSRVREDAVQDVRDCAGSLIGTLEAAASDGLIAEGKREVLSRRLAELRKIRAGYGFDLTVLSNPLKVGTSAIFTRADLKKTPGLSQADKCGGDLGAHRYVKASIDLEVLLKRILLALIADAAELLAARWNAAKKSEGRVSFSDMLRYANDAARASPSFATSIRKRIRYAIIDEFQDTSPAQWAIFRRLFLEEAGAAGPRLYLVGDPKQSIYMFQGADVGSYLDARSAVAAAGGRHYTLVENFRSGEAVIRGCNAVFTSRHPEGDWFLSGADGDISYTGADAVRVCRRATAAEITPVAPPVQVMALFGPSARRYGLMAENTVRTIRQLLGRKISVPDGNSWKNLTLDYGHFAVIVEKHALAEPFLDAFRGSGIPAVKYKMEGVFTSPMAGALIALFNAILAPAGTPAARLAVLLTPFFNRSPETIDPERDLEPCLDPTCRGDALCVSHAVGEWSGLAGRSQWARLFGSIEERTCIRERLIRLIDGERHLADLRQLSEYCIEKLHVERFTLGHLAEHLALFFEKKRTAGRDANLHTLETQKSSVKVLTMHAAKGLEFPVVFAVTGTTKKKLPNGPDVLRWNSVRAGARSGEPVTRITPYLSISDVSGEIGGLVPAVRHLEEARRERRRLLYVALTRARSLLFVPMHLKEPPHEEPGAFSWAGCKRTATAADDDLTPVLQSLLDERSGDGAIGLFHVDRRLLDTPVCAEGEKPSRMSALEKCPGAETLQLALRVCRQTSYSRLSREASLPRALDRSEEPADEEVHPQTAAPSPLPGGRHTGDAIHGAIEELLCAEDAAALLRDGILFSSVVGKHLDRSGILSRIRRTATPGQADSLTTAATETACTCIRRALTIPMEIPGVGPVAIGQLPITDRRTEMEFLFPSGRHWVHGFMDLVFRLPLGDVPGHPWRYFVLDWKTDTLAAYDPAAVAACMEDRHYTLQSRLYLHALDRFLRGMLRGGYDPGRHLGGAVYVFLRGFADPSAAAPVRIFEADSARDRVYIDELVSGKDHATHAS